jgi:Protein of unknown function (DUF455)
MISYQKYALEILLGGTLESKLYDAPVEWAPVGLSELPKEPGRTGVLKFSDKKLKFPKKDQLNVTLNQAIALHSFANHELLAIEMMAAALLIYPHEDDEHLRFKKGILTALKDEQKHLGLYVQRLNELGFEFGDFPLNDYFWRQMEKLKTPAHYTAVMSLTFEAANLDFAQYYAAVFKKYGDKKTAAILETVLEDEISHVAFGAHWMKKWRADKSLWQYYLENLPWPMTPDRAKGIGFDRQLHQQAVSDEEFTLQLEGYEDDFKITKRI